MKTETAAQRATVAQLCTGSHTVHSTLIPLSRNDDNMELSLNMKLTCSSFGTGNIP